MRQPVALTKKMVNEATPPMKGEVWIADKRVKGFGLRLWATKSGGQKAYAFRITDRSRNTVRRTYNINRQTITFFADLYPPQTTDLGAQLKQARDWAHDEINTLKGRLTKREKEWLRWRKEIDAANKMPLRLLIKKEMLKLEEGKRQKKFSENYVDQIKKLFDFEEKRVLPNEEKRVLLNKVLDTPFQQLSDKQIVGDLVRQDLSHSNMLIARAFITRIYKQYARSEDEFLELFRRKWQKNIDVRFPELRKFKKADYNRLFVRLEQEEKHWQQALCIRLYFILRASLQSIMKAEWYQFYDDAWFPYLPKDRKLWFVAIENVSNEAQRILRLVANHIEKDFANSRYLFPSKQGRQFEHIRTVQHFWKKTLSELGIKYFPLRYLALSYRTPNCPSYDGNYLRIMGPTIRYAINAKQLAKAISRRSRQSINAGNYKST